MELQLDGAVQYAILSYDGTRIGAVTLATLGVWAIGPFRPIWQVRNLSSVHQELRWSSDDSSLMVLHDQLGTLLMDGRTGERFANLMAKPAAYFVLPSLRYRISRGNETWEMLPLPAPDDGPPRASLMRVLSDAGLEMRGVELVDAAPATGAVAAVAKLSAAREEGK